MAMQGGYKWGDFDIRIDEDDEKTFQGNPTYRVRVWGKKISRPLIDQDEFDNAQFAFDYAKENIEKLTRGLVYTTATAPFQIC
jgi:hypothetical protein